MTKYAYISISASDHVLSLCLSVCLPVWVRFCPCVRLLYWFVVERFDIIGFDALHRTDTIPDRYFLIDYNGTSPGHRAPSRQHSIHDERLRWLKSWIPVHWQRIRGLGGMVEAYRFSSVQFRLKVWHGSGNLPITIISSPSALTPSPHIPMKFIPIPIKSTVLYISADNLTVYRRHKKISACKMYAVR